jgi:hypothetical protein
MNFPPRNEYLASVRPCALESIPAGQTTCCICQEDFGPDCTPTKLSCGHYVGIDCIRTWLGEIDEYGVYKNKCPYSCQLYQRTDAGRPGRPSDVPTAFAYDPRIGGQVETILARTAPSSPPRGGGVAGGGHRGAPLNSHDRRGHTYSQGIEQVLDEFGSATQRFREQTRIPSDYGEAERRQELRELYRLRDKHLSELDEMYEELEREERRPQGSYRHAQRTGNEPTWSPHPQGHIYPSSHAARTHDAPSYRDSSPTRQRTAASHAVHNRRPASSHNVPFHPSNGPSRMTGFRDIAALAQDGDDHAGRGHDGGLHESRHGHGHSGRGSDHNHGHAEASRSLFDTGGYSLGGRAIGFGRFLDRLERNNRWGSWDGEHEGGLNHRSRR